MYSECGILSLTSWQKGGCFLENAVDGLDAELAGAKEDLHTVHTQIDLAKEKLDKPFERGEELRSMTKELSSINAQLDIGKENIGAVVEEVEESITATLELGFER